MITSNTLGHSPAWLDDGRLKDLDINLPVVHLVSHRVWGSERDKDSKTKCLEPQPVHLNKLRWRTTEARAAVYIHSCTPHEQNLRADPLVLLRTHISLGVREF